MKKKYFLKICLLIVILVIAGVISFNHFKTIGKTEKIKNSIPDLILSTGENPEELYRLSIKALGGLKSFNIKGKRVLIKPTLLWNKAPEYGVSTNPELIKRIIGDCYAAGAWEVYIIDHTVDDWRKCYKISEIEKASKLGFGKILPANEKKDYKEFIYNGIETNLHFHKIIEKCDFIINVPSFSVIPGVKISAGLSNLSGLTWENRSAFENCQDESWSRFFMKFKPDLTIIDAGKVYYGETPQNSEFQDIRNLKTLIVSKDPLLAESAAYKLANISTADNQYLKELSEMGFGNIETKNVSIQYIETR